MEIVGRSAAIRTARERVARAAAGGAIVLVAGEPGVGKEHVARAIHASDPRTRDRPFAVVHCAAGLGGFPNSSVGTFFVDEAADLDLAHQTEILRDLEGHDVPPRLILATRYDPARLVREGRLLRDLFRSAGEAAIDLPPLRDRREDIPLLVERFIEKYNRELKRSYRGADGAANPILVGREWPGNVRELENAVERAMIVGDGRWIRAQDLTARPPAPSEPDDLREAIRAFELRHIRRALERVGDNVERAAERLGVTLAELRRKLDELGMGTVPGITDQR